MKILSRGDTVAIVACSNGLEFNMTEKMCELEYVLKNMGLNVIMSNNLYRKYSAYNGTGKERADTLMKFYEDEKIKAIFDVSGGDLANEILEHLDFNKIEKYYKPYFGYSDLTVVLNSIYAKTGKKSYLYQIRNLIDSDKLKQVKNFEDTFIKGNKSILNFNYEWIQGSFMEGIVVGGNIRCLLKLAGTEYMPDFKDKILFLESFSGNSAKMATYLTQLRHIGVFKKIRGIILGSYTEMEKEKYKPSIVELTKEIVNDLNIPIIKTGEIGHGKDSKCIIIGENIKL